ncbi:MAG TPA: NAD(P)-dependent oxidoreductase [Candidatus Binataceae bacterium]
MSVQVGFVGTGAMGLPIANNLIEAGHQLRIYNRTIEKASPLAAKGARLMTSAGETATPGGIVFTMLSDDGAVEGVSIGDHGLAARLAPGGIHVSMSTIAPATARKLAAYHRERGSVYVAAPVFGRPQAAAARQLSVCLAGPKPAIDRVQPLLEATSRRVFNFGDDPGAANVVKLCGNFLIASAIEAMSEAFAMAEKAGVERTKVHELLSSSLFACPVYQGYGEAIANKRHEPAGFRLALGLKDIELALRTARELTMPLPTASLVRDRFLAAMAKGRADMDWSALALGALEDAALDTQAKR